MYKQLQKLFGKIQDNQKLKKKYIIVLNTKLNIIILSTLKQNNFIRYFIVNNNNIVIFLKYINKFPSIRSVICGSKTKPVFYTNKELYFLNQLSGLILISTSLGIVTVNDAIKYKIGGLFICRIL